MAFLCDNCQLFFPRKLTNCPFCGGKIYTENVSEESLKQDGYSLVSMEGSKKSNESTDPFVIDDSDIIASLRKSYHNEHVSNGQPHPQIQRTATNPDAVSTDNASSADQHYMGMELGDYTNEGGFFSQFQSSGVIDEIPTVSQTPTSNQAITTTTQAPAIDEELRSIERQQRQIRNNYRRIAFLNFLTNIRWRTVFRIILIIGIVFCALTIWKMRYIILDSIMSFIISLLQLIIIVWIIVYLIKSLFK